MDPEFGKVNSKIFTQIRPSNPVKVLETNASYDSVTLHLVLDYYNYGSKLTTPQTFTIHELTEVMDSDSAYDQRSNVAYDPTPIISKTITVDPVYFDKVLEERIKDTIFFSTKLDGAIGRKLFQILASSDSTLEKFDLFQEAFKGLAIVPVNSDKVLGLNPSTALSMVELHYHVDTVKRDYPFYFDYVGSFSRIETDHSGTAIANFTTPRLNYPLNDGKVYAQSGFGLFPNISFQNLISLRDTVPGIVFNSVQLTIPVAAYGSGTPPPEKVGFRVLDKDNSFYPPTKLLWTQYLTPASTGNEIIPIGVYIRNDLGLASTALTFDADTKSYSGYITQFAQSLVTEDDPTERFLNFALFAMSPEANKGVDRFSFNAADVKLKVYYTKAIKNTKGE
jgi:hypothetical protein